MAKVQFDGSVLRSLVNAAAKEEDRPVLHGVYVDPEGWLVAANGFILAARKVHIDVIEGDFTGAILPYSMCKERLLGGIESAIDTQADTVTAPTKDGEKTFRLVTGNFPNWRTLIPTDELDKPRNHQVFNPAYLVSLAKAFDRDWLNLFHSHGNGPAMWVTDDEIGLIMPMFAAKHEPNVIERYLKEYGFLRQEAVAA